MKFVTRQQSMKGTRRQQCGWPNLICTWKREIGNYWHWWLENHKRN